MLKVSIIFEVQYKVLQNFQAMCMLKENCKE